LSLAEHADDLFPHYIAFHLPPVVSGLVVAALFAAAMSSIDSGVNSIAAVVQTDFFDRIGRRPQTEAEKFRRARWLAFAIGAIVVVGSSQMGLVLGNITAVTNRTSNLLTVPIFCLFFFALFVPCATPIGVWTGAVCGIATAALVAFSGPIFGADPTTGYDPISFQWIGPAALVVNVAVGWLVSRATASRGRPGREGGS
jgi:SSS family solute:Na+ symporter